MVHRLVAPALAVALLSLAGVAPVSAAEPPHTFMIAAAAASNPEAEAAMRAVVNRFPRAEKYVKSAQDEERGVMKLRLVRAVLSYFSQDGVPADARAVAKARASFERNLRPVLSNPRERDLLHPELRELLLDLDQALSRFE